MATEARELQHLERRLAALTPFHERILAEELTARGGDTRKRLAGSLTEAKVDLNPHQIEAASFALDSLSRGGCMLADEVGLGKTIEAGIVLGQMMAEGRSRILILAPATLRAQWQSELHDKFGLDSVVVDGRSVRAIGNCFDHQVPVICSHPFAANKAELVAQISWDLVVVDEAHRLRNAYKPTHKTGAALRGALRDAPKMLLTATPLQNSLLELFGLLSFLDEQILGPESAFRSRYTVDQDGCMTEGAVGELKERLSGVVHRTLRRQVREYVRYTNRRSIVEDFAPSAQERELYESVSEYLRRADACAIEPSKKTLLTLVYRKLLSSSTHAIAPTLKKLAAGLRKRIEAAKLSRAADNLLYIPEEANQYSEEAEAWSDPTVPTPREGLFGGGDEPSLEKLQSEAFELEQYARLAEGIGTNAKGEALKRALDRTFTVAKAHGWPEKAVIFTESRRTLDYLFKLLSDHGFAGKISVLSGDAGTPEARKALVQEFRDRSQILLSTEAGAEGLNLQFCNLVVNYDLPWNPQRVEQRIGRCHRYGQQRDVVVINFLNSQNAADARLFELLEKKLSLFDGVFGASDEILGALENGVDFERRVLDIYQSCRKPEEINAAFDALRGELESRIDERMTQARSLLLERFDGDIRRRLRFADDEARAELEGRRQKTRVLTESVLGQAGGALSLTEAADIIRRREHDPVSYLALDGSVLPSRLSHLVGKEGWWFAYRFTLTGLRPEERIVHLVLVREGDGFRALNLADGKSFPRLPARVETERKPAPVSVSLSQERALLAAREELVREAERKNAQELDITRERADRFAEDCLLAPRNAVVAAREAWEQARKAVLKAGDPQERLKARTQADRLERDYRRKLNALRNEEDRRYMSKDRSVADLDRRARVEEKRALVGTAYFWIS